MYFCHSELKLEHLGISYNDILNHQANVKWLGNERLVKLSGFQDTGLSLVLYKFIPLLIDHSGQRFENLRFWFVRHFLVWIHFTEWPTIYKIKSLIFKNFWDVEFNWVLFVRFSSFHLKIGDKIIFLLSVCDPWLLSMNMVAWIKVWTYDCSFFYHTNGFIKFL